MRTCASLLLALLCACDFGPIWGTVNNVNRANPFPDATCFDICQLEGQLCLRDQCDGETLMVWDVDEDPLVDDADLVPITCFESINDVAGPDVLAACCCSSL